MYHDARVTDAKDHLAKLVGLDTEYSRCTHGITFDEEAARGLSSDEVRRRWPRGWFWDGAPCPLGCGYGVGSNGSIYYASFMHYLAGDW